MFSGGAEEPLTAPRGARKGPATDAAFERLIGASRGVSRGHLVGLAGDIPGAAPNPLGLAAFSHRVADGCPVAANPWTERRREGSIKDREPDRALRGYARIPSWVAGLR